MIEFAPGYLQVKVSHLTRNYFPLATPQPTQAMYEDGARRNPATDPESIRQRKLRRDLFAFSALSELALLTAASFGKRENAGKIRREISVRRAVKNMAEAARLPYAAPNINLL